MAEWTIPTLAELRSRVMGDIVSHTRNPASVLWSSLGYALAFAHAAAMRATYLYQQWVADQIIPDRADSLAAARWERIYGITAAAATKATGIVVVTGAVGATVNTGDVLQRSDATRYLVTAGPYNWATSTTKDVTVEAETAGEDANLDYAAGVALTFVSPPAGIVASAPLKTSTDISGGADTESAASMLARLLSRLQDPPQGGSKSDYGQWAQAALPTTDRTWLQSWTDPGSLLGAGEVKLLFTVEGDGTAVIPTGGNVTTVSNYLAGVVPAEADYSVVAPTGHAFTLALDATLEEGYAAADVEAAIASEIQATFRDVAEVAELGQTIPLSHIHDAVALVNGIVSYEFTAVDGGGATADVVLTANQYPTVVAAGIVLTEV